MIMLNNITCLKQDFTWLNPPKSYELDGTLLKVKPYGKTDFIRSYNSTISDNASFYFSEIDGDFCIQAELNCELKGKYDAGALMIRSDESQWAKLCIEKCADEGVSIVSVVTNLWSDDTNNERLNSANCHLRIIRKGNIIAFHYSLDGHIWRFVRKFPIHWGGGLQVGIAVQAPFFEGAEFEFKNIQLMPNVIDNFRNGS